MREYTEFADGALVFPYKGKKYAAPEIGIKLGLRLNGITNNGEEQDLDSVELFKLVLGPVWDEMIADGVPLTFATRAGATMLADFQFGRAYAEAMWETGGDPKAMTEYMKARGNRATRRSKSTGGATKTPSPASTKATTSRSS
ncbi:DUF7426 family protein [Microbacterium allomyrinae]|uniref:DUF7426 domain-containing protein n=1 Tax=Microbacterium allomyrinae TaxID=2830666 RepID=A0A9X1LWN5_9MICO|nr:hypothetical protein [Microbacterium allomyrinae]MCC2033066.1 hypothetical protein [Microbacterium allomyrinae]